jgi:hypothetical protein
LVKINGYFCISVGDIGKGRVGDCDHDVVDVGYLDSAAFDPDLSVLYQFGNDLGGLHLEGIVDQPCMILKRTSLAGLLNLRFPDKFLLKLPSFLNLLIYLLLGRR